MRETVCSHKFAHALEISLLFLAAEIGLPLEPRMLEQGLAARAPCRVQIEHHGDELLGVVRNPVPNLVVEIEVAVLDLVQDFGALLRVEGRHPAQDEVQKHPARPDIALLVVGAFQDLRRDIQNRACNVVDFGVLFILERYPEVNHLDL